MSCLIVERHEWETGGGSAPGGGGQLQLVLDVAERFFGPGGRDLEITVRVFMPADADEPLFDRRATISRVYENGTRRVNGIPELAGVPSAFIFFEETDTPNVYDMWWQEDKAPVAARFNEWDQARNSQYGRGRLSTIVDGRVARPILRVD
jgi:hypothetical protein